MHLRLESNCVKMKDLVVTSSVPLENFSKKQKKKKPRQIAKTSFKKKSIYTNVEKQDSTTEFKKNNIVNEESRQKKGRNLRERESK